MLRNTKRVVYSLVIQSLCYLYARFQVCNDYNCVNAIKHNRSFAAIQYKTVRSAYGYHAIFAGYKNHPSVLGVQCAGAVNSTLSKTTVYNAAEVVC